MSDKSEDDKNGRGFDFRKIWEFIKSRWVFILLLAWAITTFILLRQKWDRAGDLISATAVETLVFVTWFYAVQTRKLVEEEKKNRETDLIEKRIAEFYVPITDILHKIKECFPEGKSDIEAIFKWEHELSKVFRAKAYMVSPATADRIAIIFPYILQDAIDSQKNKPPFHDYEVKQAAAIIVINREWKELEDQLRKLYGIE